MLALLLSMAGTALGNGIPDGAVTFPTGGALRPVVEVPVAVEREHLRISVTNNSAANVKAAYTLRNRTDQRVTGRLQPASARTGPGDLLVLVHHTTGARKAAPAGSDVCPGAGHRLQRFVDRAYRVDYLLRPARHWAGFGKLTVDLEVPLRRAVWSSLPLEQQDAGHYRAVVEGLPEENRSIFIAPGGGAGWLASLWWVRTSRTWLLVALTVAGAVAGALLGASERDAVRRAGLCVGFGVPLLVYVLTPRYLFGVGAGGTVITWFFFLPGMMILYGVTWWVSKTTVRWGRRGAL